MKDLFIKDSNWKKVNIVLKVETYVANPQIAILLYEKKSWDFYWDLSVYIKPLNHHTLMAVDTNNIPNAEDFIHRYHLWVYFDFCNEGFRWYPIYAMNITELLKYDSIWTNKFLDETRWK